MEWKARAINLVALCSMIPLYGCSQSAPPMSRTTFAEAARRCALRVTTYTYRDGLLIDEPLIDFTEEREPAKAHACFNAALERVDQEIMARGVKHVSYIWEWRA